MQFKRGTIADVIWRPLRKYHDGRGWLCELFRIDEIAKEYHPAMGYLSQSGPGIARGPHEHAEQADFFCFLGPGNFQVYLWDNRAASPTYRVRQVELVGEERPMALIIPPGVVHAYKNVSAVPGLVFNCPNRLYKGPGRTEPVDEIRHEDNPDGPFRLEG